MAVLAPPAIEAERPTTHRKTLLRKRQDEKPSEIEAEAELLEDNDLVEIATQQARAELGDLDAAIAHVDRMLAVSGAARNSADARVNAILDWIEAEMLDASHAWRDRRLLLFTEWDDTRRWLVERLKEGLLQRCRGHVDLNGRILVFTRQTSLEERERIKIAFNAPFDQEPVRILVCTDAARKGLNIQARCYDLIHVDLPWNPFAPQTARRPHRPQIAAVQGRELSLLFLRPARRGPSAGRARSQDRGDPATARRLRRSAAHADGADPDARRHSARRSRQARRKHRRGDLQPCPDRRA